MILITGAAGYIGSHTAIAFLKNNYDIVVFDNLENGHIETIERLHKISNFPFERGDLRNREDIRRVFEKHKIDGVIHFAAHTLVEESVKNPSKYYHNNVLGTLNLLDTMVEYGVKNIVFSSTCAIYGEPQYTPIDEKHPQNPVNAYGNTKLCVEMMMKDYDRAYGLKSIKLRYFNVAGCDRKGRIGEWHEPETHLIPNILKASVGNETIFKIFGDDYDTKDGTCVRDYVNVEDLAAAHLLAYEYLKENHESDCFNIGTGLGNSVKEVFDSCENVIDKKIPVEICERRPSDPANLYANIEKAKSILKWQPDHTLEDSIESAYKWELELKNIKEKGRC